MNIISSQFNKLKLQSNKIKINQFSQNQIYKRTKKLYNNFMNSQMNTEDSQNAAGSFDQEKLSALKKQISLSKSQLLQLAYDDEKFITKLQQLNKLGYDAIIEQSYNQAAENILQYAASCGKTIQRSLIIATLQNQACVYHRVWQLQKSINYIQAIIYNITSFLQTQKGIQLRNLTLNQNSDEYIRTSIYIKNKLHLVFYYLQFCAVSSQNQSHQNALSAASKALNIMKELCEEEYNLERIIRKSEYNSTVSNSNFIDQQHQQMLLQLHNIKQCRQQNSTEPLQKSIQKFLIKAKKTTLKYKIKVQQNRQKYPKLQKQLQTFSIGIVMQINPTTIPKAQQQILNIKQQLQYIKKIYKAIYISICHFTMATELRLLSSQKYPIDQEMKKQSYQYKTSQLHHLIAIITGGLYIPCQTAYLDHILNSFKNHYQIDLAQKDSQISLTSQTWNQEDDDLIHLQTSSLNLKKEHMNNNYQQEIGDIISGNKMKNSIKHLQNGNNQHHNIMAGSPEIYKNMKKGMSKNKNLSAKESQKSLKTSAHQSNFNTPLTFTVERNKSKSKGKNVKKSNLKESSKSRKKSSRKIQQKVKSPSIHKKLDADIKKKASDMKQKKLSDMKGTSRSKSKSRKKGPSRSRHELQGSVQKITNTKNYMATTYISSKKIPPSHHVAKTQKQYGLGNGSTNNANKILSNNVYIQRSNNHKQQKDKKLAKKQTNSTNSAVSNTANAQSITLKFVNLKKNKSPSSHTATTLTQKDSRSLNKKGVK